MCELTEEAFRTDLLLRQDQRSDLDHSADWMYRQAFNLGGTDHFRKDPVVGRFRRMLADRMKALRDTGETPLERKRRMLREVRRDQSGKKARFLRVVDGGRA